MKEKSKKPLTGYFVFLAECRQKKKAEDAEFLEKLGKPEEGLNENKHLTKRVGELWKELSKEEQEVHSSFGSISCVGKGDLVLMPALRAAIQAAGNRRFRGAKGTVGREGGRQRKGEDRRCGDGHRGG